ncbi:hypothetical protein LTR80_011501 [Exophiala xenobiotica]
MPRSPHSSPVTSDSPVQDPTPTIAFHHPGYPEPAQCFLDLPACDEGSTLSRDVALVACALIACNRYDGYFTLDAAGEERIETTQLACRVNGYYFQLPDTREYPIYPSFRHWNLPSHLPDPWVDPDIEQPSPYMRTPPAGPSDVKGRDDTCRVTNHYSGTELAHIVPGRESEWWTTRGLARLQVNAASNTILLRADVHRLLDSRALSFIPRESGNGEKIWVTYIMKRLQRPQEVHELYHDRQTQPFYGIKAEYLFCRFAWTVFDSVHGFLHQGYDRWLRYRTETQEEVTRKVAGLQCKDDGFTRRGRSQSPSKRKRAGVSGQQDFEQADFEAEISDDEERRGRKRRRTWSRSLESGSGSSPIPRIWSSASSSHADTDLGEGTPSIGTAASDKNLPQLLGSVAKVASQLT